MSRGGAEIKPLCQRIFSSALLMALFGWLVGLIYGPDEALLTAIISGALLGLLSVRPLKAALGLVVGACLGVLFELSTPVSNRRWWRRRWRSSIAWSLRSPTVIGPWSA